MKMPTFPSPRSTPRLFAVMLVAALAGCATVSPPPQKSDAAKVSPPSLPGTETISGDDLRNTGRTDNAQALRALSPIFH